MRTPPTLILLTRRRGGGVTGAQSQEGFRFRSGVEFVNVTATVTDGNGRFVSGLRQEDFTSTRTGRSRTSRISAAIAYPVSLGIALDASGSMTPGEAGRPRAAIERLIFKLLDEDDELFFVEFATRAEVTQGWTTDRQLISDALKRVDPVGGTALYDAVAERFRLPRKGATGRRRCSSSPTATIRTAHRRGPLRKRFAKAKSSSTPRRGQHLETSR